MGSRVVAGLLITLNLSPRNMRRVTVIAVRDVRIPIRKGEVVNEGFAVRKLNVEAIVLLAQGNMTRDTVSAA